MSLLEVHNLSVSFGHNDQGFKAVDSISFNISKGEIFGLIGESGSGKSVASQSLTRLIAEAQLSGKVVLHTEEVSHDLITLNDEALRKIRKENIAYIFQEPMTALNPLMRCGDQVLENASDPSSAYLKELLQKVELQDVDRIAKSYPHELSGGQRQRIMIAMALARKPRLLIADEPTTALDVSVQHEIITLLKSLSRTENMAVLFITHDLLSLECFADRIAVMYHGKLVETGKADDILSRAKHPYTKALIASRATYDKKGRRLSEIEDMLHEDQGELLFRPSDEKALPPHKTGEVIMEVRDLSKSHFQKHLFHSKEFKVLQDVSLSVNEGDTLGIIGESGSGKSTIAKIILSLWSPTKGKVVIKGRELDSINDLSSEIQMVFQDPFSSLNPKHRIGDAIAEVAKTTGIRETKEFTRRLLTDVGLSPTDYMKYPHEFSGGQRQRICIAKSLAKQPSIIVLDEAVSALDVSVQAKIVNLLNDLQQQKNLTFVLISHDINVVSYFCNKMVVLKDGRIVESGSTDKLIAAPQTEYTRSLLESSIH